MTDKTAGSEKTIASGRLVKLLDQKLAVTQRMAKERGGLGETIAKAVENDNLDPVAFGLVAKIYKMAKDDAVKAAWVWRHVLLYGDMIGLGDQQDIEDVIRDPKQTAADVAEAASDREDDPIDEVLANGGKAALERFRLGLQDVDDPARINKGLDAFAKDFPELKDMATQVVADRRKALGIAPN